MKRRHFLKLAGALSVASAVPHVAVAQSYPARPVRWLVGFPAGGSADMVVRMVADGLSERLGQTVVVDNRAGAGTNIATEAGVRAAPDGYTIMLVTPANATNASLYDKLPFNFLRDVAPVAGLNLSPMVLLVHPSSPIRSTSELVAYAKANPGKLSMAIGSNGTVSQMTHGLLKMMAGVDILGVPYRGEAPALTDMLGRQVDSMFVTLTSALEFVRDKRLRALAVTTSTRADALPDVPVMADAVPGFEATTWNGVGAPKDTPAEIVARLNRDINATLNSPKVKARFTDLGASLLTVSPAEFGKHVQGETEKWGKVVKFLGLKPN